MEKHKFLKHSRGNFNTYENICLGEINKKVFCGFELKHILNLKDENAFLMLNKY
jgi:hypothetical protein